MYGGVGNRTTIPNLSGARLKSLPIPLPSLPEQRAIAAVLSKIQEAIEAQEKTVTALKGLKAETMAKLFREGLRGEPLKQTEIGEIPESWKVHRLAEIARIGNGSTPKRTNPAYWEGGTIPWLASAKVHDVIIRQPSELVTELAIRECHLPMVAKGSIVVAITGQGKTLGNAALVTFDTRINQHLAFIQVNDPNVNPEFVLTYLAYRYEDLRRAGAAGGSTKAALTCAYLETYPIPKPTLEEQRRIALALMTLNEAQDVVERRCDALRSLFSATLHLLMTGQIRVPAEMVARLGGGLGPGAAGSSRSTAEERKGGRLDEALLQEIVRRIVEAVLPEKIILFGSAARGEMGPDSDLDLLVVKTCERRREVARAVRACLRGVAPGRGKDVVVVTPADVERDRDTIGYVIRPALREGRVLYAA